jgi:hypothetical protein
MGEAERARASADVAQVRRIQNRGPDPRVRFDLACATGSIVDHRVPAQSEPPAVGESVCNDCAASPD